MYCVTCIPNTWQHPADCDSSGMSHVSISLYSEAQRFAIHRNATDGQAPAAALPGLRSAAPLPADPVPSIHMPGRAGQPAGDALRLSPVRLASPLCKYHPRARSTLGSAPESTKRLPPVPEDERQRRSPCRNERSAAPGRAAGERVWRRAAPRPDLGRGQLSPAGRRASLGS